MRVDFGAQLGYRLSRIHLSGVAFGYPCVAMDTKRLSGGAAGEAPDQRSNSRWPNSDDRTRYRRLVLRDRILRHRLRVLPDQDRQLALTTDAASL